MLLARRHRHTLVHLVSLSHFRTLPPDSHLHVRTFRSKVSRIPKDRLNRIHLAWLRYKSHNLVLPRADWLATLHALHDTTTHSESVYVKNLDADVVRRAGRMVGGLIMQVAEQETEIY